MLKIPTFDTASYEHIMVPYLPVESPLLSSSDFTLMPTIIPYAVRNLDSLLTNNIWTS